MNTFNKKSIPTLLLFSIFFGACSQQSPEEQIKSAKEYLSKSASIQIKSALQQNPNSGEGRFLLGKLLLESGNATDAEIELRKSLAAEYPKNIVLPQLARAMLALGQAKKLTDEFEDIRLNEPIENADLQISLAAAHANLGDKSASETALAAALSSAPNYPPALLIKARQKAAAQDTDGAFLIVESVISKSPENADAWKLKGDLLFYTKDNSSDALEAYRMAIVKNPKLIEAHLAILSILIGTNKTDEATSQLQHLKEISPNNPEVKYIEAQIAFKRKDYKTAKEISDQLLRLASNNPRILQLAGGIEFQLNSLPQAEIYLARAVQAAPELLLPRKLLIATYVRSGQASKALTELKTAAGKGELHPDLFSLAGQVYLQNGDAAKAEEYFSKALKLDPDDVEKRTALATTQLTRGKPNALGELQSIAVSDDGITADLSLISLYLKQKKIDKALQAINQLEAKQPGKPLAANLRGQVHLIQKDSIAARQSFERALAIDPNYFSAVASLASLDMADNKPDDARVRFEKLVESNPKNVAAILSLANLASFTGADKTVVEKLLTKAVNADPTSAIPRLSLINLHLKNNDIKLALAAAQDAVTTLPNDADLLDALGRAQQQSGDMNQALTTYAKVVSLQPLSVKYLIRLADANLKSKNIPAAEKNLLRALEISPDSIDAQRRLIILLIESKKYSEALAIAQTVKIQRKTGSAGFLLEGDINLAQKKWGAAEAAYLAGLQIAPSGDTAAKLHTIMLLSGKQPEAEKFAVKWLKNYPKDSVFLSYFGDLAISTNDYAAAEKAYLMVLQITPNNAIALNNLAWVTGKLKKPGAVAYAKKANTLQPNIPSFMDTLASLLAEEGVYEEAISLQTRAVALRPIDSQLKINLAKILIKSGNKNKAKIELENMMKTDGDSSIKLEAAELIKKL